MCRAAIGDALNRVIGLSEYQSQGTTRRALVDGHNISSVNIADYTSSKATDSLKFARSHIVELTEESCKIFNLNTTLASDPLLKLDFQLPTHSQLQDLPPHVLDLATNICFII